jgi:hypothetical protein
MAVELLAKAALAQFNPVLIADPKNIPTFRLLCGIDALDADTSIAIRTISGSGWA